MMKKLIVLGLCGTVLLAANPGVIAEASEPDQEVTQEHVQELPYVTLENVTTFDDVIDPSEPVDPEVPTDPGEPTDPEVPTDPGEPVDPEIPTDPGEPTDPEVPTDPGEPTDPEIPTEPTDPTEPEKPVDPTEPEKPTKPTEPTKPVNPTQPTEPSKPTQPVDTTPSPQQPVQGEGGQTIIGVDNGNPIIQEADGTTKTVTPESIGATKQADGSLLVKDSSGKMKVLPKMGEAERAMLSASGGVMMALASFFLVKRNRKRS